jgi:carboxymethylenebutenolidase
MITQEITTERVRIEVSDGTTMEAHVARPASAGPHPGLVLLQEIFGVNAHIRDVAARLAREGYVVLAPDLFHRVAPGYEAGYENIQDSIGLAMKYTATNSEADVRAACAKVASLDGVRADRIGAIGFCMGGRLAFVANAVAPLKAAVSYYGGGIGADKLHLTESLSGPMLFYWAGRDAYIPAEQRRAVTDALAKAEKPHIDVFFSQQDHGFFCDARSNYDAAAAAQSWELTRAFLKSNLQG